MGRFLLVSYLEPRVLAYIATAKVIRTFLIVETVRLNFDKLSCRAHGEALDFLSFCLLPSAIPLVHGCISTVVSVSGFLFISQS